MFIAFFSVIQPSAAILNSPKSKLTEIKRNLLSNIERFNVTHKHARTHTHKLQDGFSVALKTNKKSIAIQLNWHLNFSIFFFYFFCCYLLFIKYCFIHHSYWIPLNFMWTRKKKMKIISNSKRLRSCCCYIPFNISLFLSIFNVKSVFFLFANKGSRRL